MPDGFCPATCMWPGNCPCFDRLDEAMPTPEEVDAIVCDYIGLTTNLCEKEFER